MVLASNPEEEPHPYWYGRVVGIFHVNARYDGTPSRKGRLDVLWVRWFESDTNYKSGWKHKRLPRLKFRDASSPDAFGFVDPESVIRGGHLLPAFIHGKTDSYLIPTSIAC